ncbi:MAG: DtxR family transcriptional regulator [Anaerolineales bacterium]
MYNPLIALFAAVIFMLLIYWLFRPEAGVVPQWRRAQQLGERARSEDALKHIYSSEMDGERPSIQSLAGALHITMDNAAEEVSSLVERELVELSGSEITLTAEGRTAALHIIRAHRLWERYLADETGYSEVEWHDRAELEEHQLSPEELDTLSARLGYPRFDPHGDPIPTADGNLVVEKGIPLTSAEVDTPVRIHHLEDEPEAVYAQLVAERLYPGMEVRLIECEPQRVSFWAGGDEHILAPIVAANVFVVPIPAIEEAPILGEPLTVLAPGERGTVISISRASRGLERRRLMDLGLLPGTEVEADFQSPTGDPMAYHIRGAVIALRKEQAAHIYIEKVKESV